MSRPRWPDFNRAAETEWVRAQRDSMLPNILKAEKEGLGQRIAATRKQFRHKPFVGDIHSHTPFSDGVSAIAENKEIADLLGLDFLFITDHRTLRHKRYCDARAHVWWGQEPPSCGMDIGVLMPRALFVPRGDSLAADFRRALKLAPFAWIPHPTGYGQSTRYPAEMQQQLWELSERFAMEILNGSGKYSQAYNEISAEAVQLWDELLCAGRQVTALGSSDAHVCYSIGAAWSGVYASACTPEAVIKALAKGHSFASEAPLLWLSCEQAQMGDVVRKKSGARIRIRFAAADSLGLHSVRIVSAGKVIRKIAVKDAPEVSVALDYVIRSAPAYFRLECTAMDQRRAFSSPLFILPA